jgi:hypothetical protein
MRRLPEISARIILLDEFLRGLHNAALDFE